jgi:hypothetical protein
MGIYPVSGGEARVFQIPSKNFWVALHDLRWLPDASGISFCGTTSDETPEWKEEMKAYKRFHLDLDTGKWGTLTLDGVGNNRSEWRGDGKGICYTSNMSASEWNVVEKDMQTGNERGLCGIAPGLYTLRCSRDYTKLAFSSNLGGIEIVDAKTGERSKKFAEFELSTWSPDGRYVMARTGSKPAYYVISLADGTSQEYDLSEHLPKGDRWLFDWSPLGNQVALSSRVSQFDAYIIPYSILTDQK